MTDTNMSSFFDELVRAKQAMETLPQVQVELAKAQGERDVIRERFEKECAHSESLREIVRTQDTEFAAKEAELSAATFREQQLRDKLEMLLGTFKFVIGESQAVVDLIEPKPEPVIETVTQEASNPDYITPTDAVDVPSNPTVDSEAANPTETSASTELPGTFPWSAPKIGDPEDTAYMYAEPYGFTKPSEAAREPEVNPTEMKQTAPSASGSTEAATAPTGDSPTTSPYWEKPTTTLWLDWRNSGGELAPWVKGMSDDQLRFAY